MNGYGPTLGHSGSTSCRHALCDRINVSALRVRRRFPTRHLVAILLAIVAAQAQQYTISTIAGRGQPLYYASALSAAIQPSGIAVDASGGVYFSSANALYRLDLNGGLKRIAGGYVGGCAGDGGLAINAQLRDPTGIAVDATGTVYIADSDNGRIRKVSPDGVITSLIVGTSNIFGIADQNCGPGTAPISYAGLGLPREVAVDSAGAVYVVAFGDIIKVSDGVVTIPAGIAGLSIAVTGGVAVDAAGDLYTTSVTGNVLKIAPDGKVSTVLTSNSAKSGLAVDAAGNVYFTDETVKKITPDGVVGTLVDSDTVSYEGVAIDAKGDLYTVAGSLNIVKLSVDGVLLTVAGYSPESFFGDGGSAKDALLADTAGVTLDAAGSLYVADSGNYRVRKIASDGTITTVAGGAALPYSDNGDNGDSGPAMEAFVDPAGLAVDGLGNLYIGEPNDIRKVGPDGVISTYQTTTGYDLASGPDGSLYVSGATVSQFLPTGAVVPVAGNGLNPSGGTICIGPYFPAPVCPTPSPLGDGGPATQASIVPAGIAVDNASNLYIADGQNRIREVINSIGIITTIAGTGSVGYSGDGGPATDAQLNGPQSVALDAAGNLYIADTGNFVVRKVSTDGIIITIAGNGSQGYSGDGGPALNAEFLRPVDLAIDTVGNIYVSDGDSIRLLTPVAPEAPVPPASTSRR